MLSEVRYGTFANYSPRGLSPLSIKSRKICGAIKAGSQPLIDSVAKFLTDNPRSVLAEFFSADTTMIPIPGSAPQAPSGLWTPKFICERFVQNGHGREVLPCLQRVNAVPKSAFAKPGERPTLQTHYASMSVEKGLFTPTRTLLVDDVITRGRTAYAAALRVHEAFPDAEIRVFSIIRTQGLIPNIAAILDPSVGVIVPAHEAADVDRRP